jgi:hypothetical protein
LEKNIEKSCLELASYLASWGMLRNSFLLQCSIKYFQKTIEYINSLDNTVWKIDVDSYTETNMDKILEIYNEINKLFVKEGSRSLTLVTKIMLGVFGFVPAYDDYFCTTFKDIANGECGFTSFNKKSLTVIKRFYDENKESIDKLSSEIFTYDFDSGTKTQIHYTKAKIIDMYGFTPRGKASPAAPTLGEK